MIMLWRVLIISFAVLVSFPVQADNWTETPAPVSAENEQVPVTPSSCESTDQEIMEMTEFLEMMEFLEDMELLDDFDVLVKGD